MKVYCIGIWKSKSIQILKPFQTQAIQIMNTQLWLGVECKWFWINRKKRNTRF